MLSDHFSYNFFLHLLYFPLTNQLHEIDIVHISVPVGGDIQIIFVNVNKIIYCSLS